MLKSIKPSGILAFLMWMRQFGGLFLPCVGLLACTMIQPIQNPTQVYAYHASGQVPGQSIVNDSPGIMRRIFEKIYLSQPFQAGCATIEVLNTYTHSNDFLQQLSTHTKTRLDRLERWTINACGSVFKYYFSLAHEYQSSESPPIGMAFRAIKPFEK